MIDVTDALAKSASFTTGRISSAINFALIQPDNELRRLKLEFYLNKTMYI